MLSQLLVLIFAFTSVMAEIHDDVERAVAECVSRVDRQVLSGMKNMTAREVHGVLCTEIRGFFICLGDMAQNEFGLSIEEMADIIFEPVDANGAAVLVNFVDVLADVCVEGTPLNNDLMADIDCFDEIDKPTLEKECRGNAAAAYEAYTDLAENIEEIDEDDEDIQAYRDRECMQNAYQAACIASAVHDTCGRRAFQTFNTIIKRTTVFQNGMCSPEALEELKTSFIESLEMEENQKGLFRLAFDLRKRRK